MEKFYRVGGGAGGDDAVGVAVCFVVDCLLLDVKFDTPKAGALFAVASEDGFCVELYGDIGLVEGDFTSIVT